ncbi:hypothetical protein POM88_036761 [Heracleum sosnowskyi]|uniref:Cytochrome P450 n=1 Tax=Heracleum sosnowskyi TaxID=360622 RepID=A0AAD8MFB2_9APIA|nr:hypothetical protein POM88_036761 [Heracleum sosnowskyi]
MRKLSSNQKDIAFSPYGDYWREMHKLCVIELFTVKRDAILVISGFCAADFFPYYGWIIDILTGFRQKLDKCFYEFDKFYESVIQEHLEPSRPRLDHEEIADILIALSKDETGPLRLSKDDIKAVFMNVYRPLNNCPGRSSELFMQQDRDEQGPEEISCRNLTKALCSKVRIKLCREVTNIHVEKCWIT